MPGFASWQLSSVPRFLAAEDVERLIASCPTDANGLRDKAVLLLLARLGLRASEVAQLKFADIDWAGGQLAVSGKGRRQEQLPCQTKSVPRFWDTCAEAGHPYHCPRYSRRSWPRLGR
jgi:integrase/recombinase XerD